MNISNVAHGTVSIPTSTPAEAPQSPSILPTPTPLQSPVVTAKETPPRTLKHLLNEQANLRVVARGLRRLTAPVDGNPVTSERIAYVLNIQVNFPHQPATNTRTTLKVSDLITRLGYKVPTTADELVALAQTLEKETALHPLGDLGGGLSWPIPMSQPDQKKIIDFLSASNTGVPGLPLPSTVIGTLGYLLADSSVSQNDPLDPAQLLQRLLDTPKARALGKALQEHLGGISSETSIYDYLLTAIHIGLDPGSYFSPIRNTVDGFGLAQPTHWGRSPSSVVEALRQYLAQGRVPPGSAKLAAHILLSKEAPQFLIKDIPEHVTVGSLAWANLTIAAAAIEAERPGSVASMSFAEVMSYPVNTQNPSNALQRAQAAAMMDWGVANGIITRISTDNYTPQQIDTVRTAFNQQLTERLTASQALDKEIPTRKEIALKELKERFGDLGSLFEEKVLGTDAYSGEAEQTGLAGEHSMLDIAMMGLPNLRPFVSSNPRIPLEALNKNRNFDAQKVFDQQFAGAIEEKKAAVSTMIRELISKLPPEDRSHFEFGDLKFFPEGSHTIDGFFNSTPRRNSPELVVKTTLNGVTQAYEINFNKGTIEPTSLSRAQTRESRAANVVFTTTELIPGDAASGIYRERPVTESPFSSFKSDRSKAIANVFVQHLELDDPAIKQQAQGQTTLDELQGGPKPLSEFLLNLIPFRSAIVNFQKGNYGEGAFDLTLDVFGFLTAGAATAGKLIKIGSSALSAGAKVLKAGKVIGAATIGVLNPLSGFGDLAKGGARLVSNGAKLVYAKGVDVVNKLRGASGSYDLLKAASKSNGVAATGTFKFADQTVEGGAALQNNKWYALDPITQRPYGPPLQDFIPATIAGNGVINSNLVNWLSAVIAPNAKTPNLAEVFRETLERVKTNHSTGFSKGYDAKGADATKGLENVPGYYPSMRLSDLKELAISTGRNPQEIGLLTKLIENRQATKSLEDAGIFSKEVAAAGGKATGMPQNLYLAQSDLASAGECAALANTMALAIQHGAQDVLIANFFKAASSAVTPGSRAFRKQLSDMHKTLRVNFHGTQAVSQVAYTDIVNRLSNATTTTIFKISTQNHGLLAGVTIKNNNKEWFFFDPNFGVATFATEDAMRRGLETTLNSGRSASTLSPIAVTNGVPTYHVSTFVDGDFLTSVPFSNPFALFNAPL